MNMHLKHVGFNISRIDCSYSQASAPKNAKNAFAFKENKHFLCFYVQQLLILKFEEKNHFEIAYGC